MGSILYYNHNLGFYFEGGTSPESLTTHLRHDAGASAEVTAWLSHMVKMAALGEKQQGHRPGIYKQKNKGHKHGKHRTKGEIERENKGKLCFNQEACNNLW